MFEYFLYYLLFGQTTTRFYIHPLNPRIYSPYAPKRPILEIDGIIEHCEEVRKSLLVLKFNYIQMI
jgi:hypothetical protein